MKNIRVFLSDNFQFLEVKFSIYLNRCVFVMLIWEGGICYFAFLWFMACVLVMVCLLFPLVSLVGYVLELANQS